MIESLLKPILVIVVSFLLKMVFTAIGIEIDDVLFNTIVAALVTWFLTQLGLDTYRTARLYFYNRSAK